MANKATWSGALPSQDDTAALSSLLTARTARTIVVVSGPEVGARSLLLSFKVDGSRVEQERPTSNKRGVFCDVSSRARQQHTHMSKEQSFCDVSQVEQKEAVTNGRCDDAPIAEQKDSMEEEGSMEEEDEDPFARRPLRRATTAASRRRRGRLGAGASGLNRGGLRPHRACRQAAPRGALRVSSLTVRVA